MPKTKKKGNGLNYKRTFLIGFGFMGCMLMWSVYNSYVPVIFRAKLTEITNGGEALPGILSVALLVNAIMTIDNIFGVIFQPYFGKRSDSTHTKWGKRMPYIIICLPICALFFSLIPVAATLKAGILSIALMMAVIIFFNFTMSVWRSPVVSLMPDFTPSHLQSDANAVINIMGGVGQMIGFVIGTIATALVGLLGFTSMQEALKAKTNSLGQILQVDASGNPVVKYFNNFDPTLAEYKEHVENFIASGRDKLYLNGTTLSGTGEEKNLVAQKVAAIGADGNPMYVNYTPIFLVAAVVSILCLVVLVIFYKRNKQYDLSKDIVIEKAEGEKAKKIKIKDLPISKEERRSLLVMLAALFLINNATEAIVPNFTNFALDTLNVKPIYSTLMMAVFAVSLAAFGIPAGAMGRKLGRKKTIIAGLLVIVVMFVIYLAVSQFVNNRMFTWVVLWIALVVGGAAVGCININTLPLVLAIGGRDYVGTFTGYYYTATFSAAITGPILCGGLIGLFGEDYNFMFLFCAIMFALGLIVITQVKHGESSKDEDTSWLEEAVENAD
ncbi:MAG: SLC45 family MFS transporter [Ruminococcaceae bacterium]|jgi:MFS family permease|nr:SLC45 family MFS transporter [Oscillospiraceae bacterium]